MSPTTRLSMCRSGGRSLITPQSARAPSAAKGPHPGNHMSAGCPEGAEHLFQCAVIAMPLRNQSMHNGGSVRVLPNHPASLNVMQMQIEDPDGIRIVLVDPLRSDRNRSYRRDDEPSAA